MDRSQVARATSSDDSASSGYLYIEIAQMTHANFEGCRQLTAYLLERIKKPNHNVKFKCLQIIKHVCLKGRAEFKQSMQRDSQPIKDCLTFSGPPDPLRGEDIYRKVREAAKETLDAVFAESPPPGTVAQQPRYASGNRIEGFGSGAAGGGPHNGGYGGGGGGPGYGGGGSGYGGSNGGGGYGGYSGGGGGGGYDGYSGGGGGGGGVRAGVADAAASIGAVGLAVGAAVGKAVGNLRARAGPDGMLPGGGGGYGGGGGGYGGGGGGYGGGYGGGGSSGMQGIGNYDPSKDKTWLERTSETVKDSVGTGIDAVQRRLGKGGGDSRYVSHGGGNGFPPSSYMSNRGPNAYDGGGHAGGGGGGYRSEAVSGAYETARANSQAYASQWNQGASSGGGGGVPGGVRGVWGGNSASARPHEDAGNPTPPTEAYGGGTGDGAAGGGGWSGEGRGRGGGGGGGARGGQEEGFVGRTGGGDADGGYEGKLVEELCAAGGTKSTPGKPEMDAFLTKASSLDPGRIADALLAVLATTDWRARSKGLAVVEALHRSDPSYRIPLEDAFQDTEQGVILLCVDSKPAVRDRAVRVSKLLGLDPSSASPPSPPPSATDDNNNGYSCAPDGDATPPRPAAGAASSPSSATAATVSGPPVDLLGGGFDFEGGDTTVGGGGGGGGSGEVDIFGLGGDAGGGVVGGTAGVATVAATTTATEEQPDLMFGVAEVAEASSLLGGDGGGGGRRRGGAR